MITINGSIIVNKFGIRYIDKIKIDIVSICNRLDIEINLVNCSNQAIDINIKVIRKNPFTNSLSI